jgi:hypothetical protein
MATSGVTAFNPAAVQIITGALRKMAVINEDEGPTAGQYKDLLFALNAMTKEWEAQGIHVWTEEEGIIFLQQFQRQYRLGTGQAGTPAPDRACYAGSWTFAPTVVAAAQGSSIVFVASVAGLSNGDNFGVVLNNGAAFWTTISNIVGLSVHLAAPLPAPVGAQACAFSYPVAAQILRPLRVPFARRLQYAPSLSQPGTIGAPDWGGIITPLSPMMSRREFFDLPQPTNPGLVTQAYYDPARDQGSMWVWNVPQNANYGLRFTWYRPIQDWTTPATTADLPQEWANALIWNLAKEAMLDYSVAERRALAIATMADKKLELVQGWDREPESVYFGRSSLQSRG